MTAAGRLLDTGLARDCRRLVGAAVVDHDDAVSGTLLLLQGEQAFAQELGVVATRDDDRDAQRRCHPLTLSARFADAGSAASGNRPWHVRAYRGATDEGVG